MQKYVANLMQLNSSEQFWKQEMENFSLVYQKAHKRYLTFTKNVVINHGIRTSSSMYMERNDSVYPEPYILCIET